MRIGEVRASGNGGLILFHAKGAKILKRAAYYPAHRTIFHSAKGKALRAVHK
jgi:hypothetical protein